jgi:hypothetical protein
VTTSESTDGPEKQQAQSEYLLKVRQGAAVAGIKPERGLNSLLIAARNGLRSEAGVTLAASFGGFGQPHCANHVRDPGRIELLVGSLPVLPVEVVARCSSSFAFTIMPTLGFWYFARDG